MIIDCILYNGEAECLDIRLHELAGAVDAFVVVEAKETFTGQPKALTFKGQAKRFSDFKDRLFYMPFTPDVVTDDPWMRERYHRNALKSSLDWLAVHRQIRLDEHADIILIGDADEIPSAEAVNEAAGVASRGIQVAFDQTLSTYYVNVVCQNMRWRGTQAIRYDKLKLKTPQGVRDQRHRTLHTVESGGWHFSSLVLDKPVERMTAKIQAFSHQECNRPEVLAPANIRRRVLMCQDIQGRTDVMFEVDRYAKLPRYVEENRAKFELLFYPGSL